ncbi:MAG: Ltp family lipoprotein, partial [Clostridia bacterium]|nr:Ltp family lipoprotein [Clostridia bacterium]
MKKLFCILICLLTITSLVSCSSIFRLEQDNSHSNAQSNALKAAARYLDSMAFSYEGLIHQLEFEKYSYEDAKYAADNCGADWNEQAYKSAKHYLNSMS